VEVQPDNLGATGDGHGVLTDWTHLSGRVTERFWTLHGRHHTLGVRAHADFRA
jgi:hypothetical protein